MFRRGAYLSIGCSFAGLLYPLVHRNVDLSYDHEGIISAHIQNSKSLFEPYNCTPYLSLGWAQLIFNVKLCVAEKIQYEREIYDFEDGGNTSIDWLFPEKDEGKLIVLLHGLTGDSTKQYMVNIAYYF